MEAVQWVDGGGPQLLSLTEDSALQHMVDQKLHPMKGNPQLTHRQQVCDLVLGYKGVKSKQRNTTAAHTQFSSDLKEKNLSMLKTGATKEIINMKSLRSVG